MMGGATTKKERRYRRRKILPSIIKKGFGMRLYLVL
jgi:hypothetical protein